MEEYKVVGPLEIAGKATGELVQLDPDTCNIQALIEGGHIAQVRKPPGKKD